MISLIKENNYYYDLIDSDDVVDEIAYGYRNYPVIEFCLTGEFGNAKTLLQKGYRCIHENALQDVRSIFNALMIKDSIATEQEEVIPYIIEKLADELEQMDSFEYSVLVGNLGHYVAMSMNSSRKMLMVPFIRMALPKLYDSFTSYMNWTIQDLMMFDTELINDYFDFIESKDLLSEYIEDNKITTSEAQEILLRLLKFENTGSVEQCINNLFRISIRCTGIFPAHFTCDVTILSCINLLYMVSEALPEHYPQPDTELFTTNMEVYKLICKLNQLLRFHMPENYTLEQVQHTILELKGTEYYIDYSKNLEYCIEHVLDEVARFRKNMFPNELLTR